MIIKLKSYVTLFLLSFLTAGCTNYKRPYPKPAPNEIISKFRQSAITNIRTQGKADIMLKGAKRLKVKVFVIFDNKGRLRLEAVTPPPMNSTVLLLTSDATSFKADDKESGVFYEGKADKCSVKNILHIPLAPADLFNYLIASPKLNGSATSLKWNSEIGAEVITVKDGKKQIKMWVSGKKGKKAWKLLKVEIKNRKNKLKIEYRGYKKYGKTYIPSRIRISGSDKKGDAVFSWSKIEINIETDPEAFDQNPPENAVIKRIICN